MKNCNRCLTNKHIDCFYLNRGKPGTICKECVKNASKRNHSKEYVSKQYYKHREKRLVSKRLDYEVNKDIYLAAKRDCYKENPGLFLTRQKFWRSENPGAFRASLAKSRAERMLRVPNWLTDEQKQQIVSIYSNCPKGLEVDHIVPLRGERVSGLYVPNNLQYLTPHENRSKGNRF